MKSIELSTWFGFIFIFGSPLVAKPTDERYHGLPERRYLFHLILGRRAHHVEAYARTEIILAFSF